MVPHQAVSSADVSSLHQAAAESRRFDTSLGRLVEDGKSWVSEGRRLLGASDSIMNNETGHKKRSSPVGGRPDDADADDYDRKRDPVGDRDSDSDADL